MSPEQQRKLLDESGVGREQQDQFFAKLAENTAALLPLLLSLLGPEVTANLMQGLAVIVISKLIGKEAAKKLIEELAKRFPWWSEWIGPIAWALSLSWLAFDLQGPAYRKTIPIMLYLGIVGLRDGPEDGEAFWSDDE